MNQPLVRTTPSVLRETTVMTIWPSIAMYAPARWLGTLYANQTGFLVVTVGNLACLAFIPASLVMYFMRVGPYIGTRYRITNRRIVVLRGISCREEKSIDFDRFDSIEIHVRPGQAWYDAGDLIFRQGNVETFRLEGVSRPQAFRTTCLESRNSHVGVKRALAGSA